MEQKTQKELEAMSYKEVLAYAKTIGVSAKFEPKPQVISMIMEKYAEQSGEVAAPAVQEKETAPAEEPKTEKAPKPAKSAKAPKAEKEAEKSDEQTEKDAVVEVTGKESVKELITKFTELTGAAVKLHKMEKVGIKHIAYVSVDGGEKAKMTTTEIRRYVSDGTLVEAIAAKLVAPVAKKSHGRSSKAGKTVEFDVDAFVSARPDVAEIVKNPDKTKSDKARLLYRAGLTIAELSKVLGIHYSFAFGVVDKFRKEHLNEAAKK